MNPGMMPGVMARHGGEKIRAGLKIVPKQKMAVRDRLSIDPSTKAKSISWK
jgi:hypothetical protein